MSNLLPVTADFSIGPVFIAQDKGRDQYTHDQAETASLVDRIYQDASGGLKLAFNDYRYINFSAVNAIPEYGQVVEEYTDMIEEHAERRVAFFFQQLVACYQTKLHFEANGAKDQAKSADAIFLSVDGKTQKLCTRNAAHSSVLPCLIAYDNAQWESYQDGEIPKPQGFVFLKGTDYYRTANTTMNMPKWVNDADREIDEKTVDSLLREKALRLVNLASQGEITPDEGISKFLEDALDEIFKAQERLQEKEDVLTPQKLLEIQAQQKVLSIYEACFIDFVDKMESNPAFLETFLNMKIGAASGDERAQRVILQLRYAAIRNSLVGQSAIIQRVQAVKAEALALVGGLDRKPNYFEEAFKTILILQARNEKNRYRLEKLLNFSPFDFEAKMDRKKQTQRTQFDKIKAKLSGKGIVDKINFLAHTILGDMRTLRTQEEYDRAQTVKELRAMKGWQQWRLGGEIYKLFPHAATSQSTISRIESRQKLVTPEIAKELSWVFNVDSGLFMPHFFYE